MNKNYEILLKNITFENDMSDYLFEGIEVELKKFFAVLSDKERNMMIYRYGLLDGKFRTLKEVSQEFNISVNRAREIETLAFRKLRMLFGLNERSFVFDTDKVLDRTDCLLEVQRTYDNMFIGSDRGNISGIVEFYRKVIEVAQTNKDNGLIKERVLH